MDEKKQLLKQLFKNVEYSFRDDGDVRESLKLNLKMCVVFFEYFEERFKQLDQLTTKEPKNVCY
jgi:hypothetical protein